MGQLLQEPNSVLLRLRTRLDAVENPVPLAWATLPHVLEQEVLLEDMKPFASSSAKLLAGYIHRLHLRCHAGSHEDASKPAGMRRLKCCWNGKHIAQVHAPVLAAVGIGAIIGFSLMVPPQRQDAVANEQLHNVLSNTLVLTALVKCQHGAMQVFQPLLLKLSLNLKQHSARRIAKAT